LFVIGHDIRVVSLPTSKSVSEATNARVCFSTKQGCLKVAEIAFVGIAHSDLLKLAEQVFHKVFRYMLR
jgi:hypothetical protein